MKQKIIPILVILAGFFLLSYPFVSNYLFEKSAGSTVESYQEKAAGMDQAIIKKVMDEAKQYNGELMRSSVQLTDPFKEKRLDGETVHYNRILNIDGRFLVFQSICRSIMGQVGQFWNMGSDIWLHLPFRLEEKIPMRC